VHEASAAVDYANGQISVTAENAPLGVVLKLISAKTGAVVDLAPELQNEPVVAQLGPSPVREALTALLDSPRVDYIVLGTGDEPGSLQRIVVRTRQSFGRVAMAAIRPPQPKPEEAEEEPKLDENGHLVSSPEQEQRMENWKKAREIQRLAEIKRQEQDRENDKLQPQTEAQPQTRHRARSVEIPALSELMILRGVFSVYRMAIAQPRLLQCTRLDSRFSRRRIRQPGCEIRDFNAVLIGL
jgi:hypothetical protein